MNLLPKLEKQANEMVESVANDPEGRYNMRYQFYQKFGDPLITTKEGFGNSELAFIRWEIRRGTLNPLDDPKPGSPWWRAVNSHFLYVATLAQLIHESGETFNELPIPVQHWLDYIDAPGSCSWYRAHNSSIIAGYEAADAIAFTENIYEQYFMNIVLYRVLYAQSMVEGVSFGILGKIFGDPRGGSVALITQIKAFYPKNYPLSKEDIKYVTHRAHNFMGIIEDILDMVFILPHLDDLYKEATQWNNSTILMKFIRNNKPIYPISESDLQSGHFNNKLTTKHFPIS